MGKSVWKALYAIGGKKQVKIILKLESPSRQNRGEKCEWHISGLGPQAISGYLRHFFKNASCLQNKDIVMLSLVASTSSLVLEVLAACPMTESLRSPVSTTLQLITGVKLPIEEFDQICRPEVNTFDGNRFCFLPACILEHVYSWYPRYLSMEDKQLLICRNIICHITVKSHPMTSVYASISIHHTSRCDSSNSIITLYIII